MTRQEEPKTTRYVRLSAEEYAALQVLVDRRSETTGAFVGRSRMVREAVATAADAIEHGGDLLGQIGAGVFGPGSKVVPFQVTAEEDARLEAVRRAIGVVDGSLLHAARLAVRHLLVASGATVPAPPKQPQHPRQSACHETPVDLDAFYLTLSDTKRLVMGCRIMVDRPIRLNGVGLFLDITGERVRQIEDALRAACLAYGFTLPNPTRAPDTVATFRAASHARFCGDTKLEEPRRAFRKNAHAWLRKDLIWCPRGMHYVTTADIYPSAMKRYAAGHRSMWCAKCHAAWCSIKHAERRPDAKRRQRRT